MLAAGVENESARWIPGGVARRTGILAQQVGVIVGGAGQALQLLDAPQDVVHTQPHLRRAHIRGQLRHVQFKRTARLSVDTSAGDLWGAVDACT